MRALDVLRRVQALLGFCCDRLTESCAFCEMLLQSEFLFYFQIVLKSEWCNYLVSFAIYH